MLIARKNKDTGEIEYTGSTAVDEELSSISPNPVQNKVITSKFSEVSEEIHALKKSVSDGKKAVADALTGQGVTTATDATFATMAENVGTVGTNKYNAGKTDYNPTDATLGNDGVLTVKNSAGTTRLTKTFSNNYNKGVSDADARVLKTNASYKQGYIDGGNGKSGEKHGASIVVTLESNVATGKVLYLYLGSKVVQQVTMSSSSHTFKDIMTKGNYTVKYSGCADVPVAISADHILDKASMSATMVKLNSLSFTVYGAVNDNITIKNSSGTVVANVVFASGQKSKSISIYAEEGNYTFISSIAKDTTNGTSAYAKTVYINHSTSRVNVYPDRAIYWYGNEISESTGGWENYEIISPGGFPDMWSTTGYKTKNSISGNYSSAIVFVTSATKNANSAIWISDKKDERLNVGRNVYTVSPNKVFNIGAATYDAYGGPATESSRAKNTNSLYMKRAGNFDMKCEMVVSAIVLE